MKRLGFFNSNLIGLIAFLLLFNFASLAQTNAAEYLGKLDKELTPDKKYIYGFLLKPANLSKYKFVRPVEKNAAVAVGQFSDPRSMSGAKYEILLVEAGKQNPYIYSDLNANGVFEETEKLPLTPTANNLNSFEQILKIPLANGFYKYFPIYLNFVKNYKNPNVKAGEKVIFQTVSVIAFGNVAINNKNVRVQYSFNAAQNTVSTTSGLFGIDVDGNGIIEYKPFSPETSYASEDEIVFRLGDLYLSTKTIDLTKNQIVMRSRAANEYLKQDLEIGKEMPDFTFVDFENKKRSLAEFKGKYLLVDFWGLWCIDCRLEIPFQIDAYKKFRARGFEILAMDSDELEKLEEVKSFLAKNQIFWTQARYDSIKTLIEKTYRIQEYPSTILLAPDGKVLILDQKQLKGAQLLETLDKILPR